MPKLTQADIDRLSPEMQQQIAEETGRTSQAMSNKERARQQWKHAQAAQEATRRALEWRAMSMMQRRRRIALSVLQHVERHFVDEYWLQFGPAVADSADVIRAHLRLMQEWLEEESDDENIDVDDSGN